MSKRRIPDPEGMNEPRADAAEEALRAFTNSELGEEEGGEEQNLSDLLADFGHLCDRNGLDFSECLRRAKFHYDEETSNKGQQFAETR